MPPQPLQAGHSFLPQRRLESDAARRSGSTVAAGAGATPAAFYLGLCRLRGILSLPASHDCAADGPFFFAARKIRVGRGRASPLRPLQADHFPLRQRRIESDAEPRCCYDHCRRNHSPLLQRRLELDAELVAATTAAGETILCCRKEN